MFKYGVGFCLNCGSPVKMLKVEIPIFKAVYYGGFYLCKNCPDKFSYSILKKIKKEVNKNEWNK